MVARFSKAFQHDAPPRTGEHIKAWGGKAMAMGDLVLPESEVNPVIAKLTAAGFEITGVHNHLLRAKPTLMYVHVAGRGDPLELAAFLRDALAVSKSPPSAGAAAPPPAVDLDMAQLEQLIGAKGQTNGGVYQFGVPRQDGIAESGVQLNPAGPLGVASAINFQPTGGGKAAITGDLVLTAEEVNPVVRELQENGIEITALHSHMLTEQPRLFFMHFWANDDAVKLAKGIGGLASAGGALMSATPEFLARTGWSELSALRAMFAITRASRLPSCGSWRIRTCLISSASVATSWSPKRNAVKSGVGQGASCPLQGAQKRHGACGLGRSPADLGDDLRLGAVVVLRQHRAQPGPICRYVKPGSSLGVAIAMSVTLTKAMTSEPISRPSSRTARVVITEATLPQAVSTSSSETTEPRTISTTLPRNWLAVSIT